jgi:hypothetical protein
MFGLASVALQLRCARQLFLVFFGMLRGIRDGSIRAASKRTISRRLFWIARFAVVAYAVISGSVEAWAERRVALVMGNASYTVPALSLSNPRNDAEDISTVLKQLDFKVVTAIDATRRDMELKAGRVRSAGGRRRFGAVLLCRPCDAAPGKQLSDADRCQVGGRVQYPL